MSVLLTASKKNIQGKPKSAKKKKRAAPSFPAGPPVSTDLTTVWHFSLYGSECTVMYNKAEQTVWCNGEDLETVDGYSDTGMDGSVIDFYITTDENSAHRGRIQRARDSKTRVDLIVDGHTIEERKQSNQLMQTIPYPDQPGSYSEQCDYTGYNGSGQYDGGYVDQTAYQQHPGYGPEVPPDSSYAAPSYNEAGQQGAYAYSGLPTAAVYEPPPQYEEVVQGKKFQ